MPRLILALWIAVTTVLFPYIINSEPTTPPASTPQPNFVIIQADDMRYDDLAFMPKLRALVTDYGLSFTQFAVSTSLCCPARATLLTGQYAHNTRIYTNDPPHGGYATFDASITLATLLHDAGYRTGIVGKYLNGYPRNALAAPGWDEWYVFYGLPAYAGYNFTFIENNVPVTYNTEYITDLIAKRASQFIKYTPGTPKPTPFFLYVNPTAPHDPLPAAPRHAGRYAQHKVPRVDTFNEPVVDDKPTWVRNLPLLTSTQITALDTEYGRRLSTLLALDDLVSTVYDALNAAGQVTTTYIIFTSDNGYHLGHHRLPAGKRTAYEEDVRVPFIIRGPGVPPGGTRTELVGNHDIFPTVLALAGVQPPYEPDGLSLVPLLTDPPTATWDRQSMLLRFGHPNGPDIPEGAIGDITPLYIGLRTSVYTYVHYPRTQEHELYERVNDPLQRLNIHPQAAPTFQSTLQDIANLLATCRGHTCHAAERMPVCTPDVDCFSHGGPLP
jgi:N-acetylglucosamine-6-sulfatase